MLSAIVLLVGLVGVHSLDKTLDVKINQGTVRGFLSEDQSFYSFTGIHYATVPQGKDRFKAALPDPTFKGTLMANETVICAQYFPTGKALGVEDCLVVNIFIPSNISLTSKTPVMAVLHGGSYLFYSGEIVAHSRLLNQGVITVTINSRLGMLGYLCLRTEAAPGNAGIKDVVAALKWIQKNIASFGGDPGNVVLYGESVGAAITELLMLSPAGNGLFHKAILESGSAISSWGVGYDPMGLAKQVAAVLGFNNVTDVSKLTEIFVAASANDLTTAITKLAVTIVPSVFHNLVCIEDSKIDPNAVVTQDPLTALVAGKYTKVPIMSTFMTREASYLEGTFASNPGYKSNFVETPENLLYEDIVFSSQTLKMQVIRNIRDLYNNLEQNNTLNSFVDFYTDYLFVASQMISAQWHAQHDEKVYLMHFAYYVKDMARASRHKDLYDYVFETAIAGPNGNLTADRVAAMFGNFIKSGNPVPNTNQLLPVSWPLYTKGDKKYLQVSDELSVSSISENPWSIRLLPWSQLYASNYNPRKLN